jgi:hypothetical protein
VTDEQGTHMQLRSLDLEELEAQRAELVPDRIEMKRRKKWRRRRAIPKGHPCAASWAMGLNCPWI